MKTVLKASVEALPLDTVPTRLRLRLRKATFADNAPSVRGELLGQPEAVRSALDVFVPLADAMAWANAFDELAASIKTQVGAARANGVKIE